MSSIALKRLLTFILFIAGMHWFNAHAQVTGSPNNSKPFPVSGNVTAQETGLPLQGVNVLVKGTNIGTVTDEKGNYIISAPNSNATLVFSYVGSNNEEKAINNKQSFTLFQSCSFLW